MSQGNINEMIHDSSLYSNRSPTLKTKDLNASLKINKEMNATQQNFKFSKTQYMNSSKDDPMYRTLQAGNKGASPYDKTINQPPFRDYSNSTTSRPERKQTMVGQK
jgi:hypothetical protein